MIFWNKSGYLVGVIVFVCTLMTELITETISGDGGYYQNHLWPMMTALIIAATIIWFLGRHLNSKPEQEVVHPKTGETIIVKPDHKLLFIPMQYWGFIVILFMLYDLFSRKR